MHGVMRGVGRGLVAAAALTGLGFLAPDQAQAQSPGCTAVNGFSLSFNAGDAPGPIFTPGGAHAAGDSVTITLTLGAGAVLTDFGIIPPEGGGAFNITGNPNTTTVVVHIVATAVTGSFEINASGPAGSAGTLSFACGNAATTGPSRIGAAQQNAMNAQVATANGQQVLQQSNDAIKLGILSAFSAGSTSQTAQARLADRAKIEKLANQEAELVQQLADLPAVPGDGRRRELEQRLALTQRNLAFARTARAAAGPMSTPVDNALDRTAGGEERKSAAAPTAMRISGAQLGDFCAADDCQADPSTTRWNGWFDGRLVGATDSLAQQNAFGFVGVGGVDYKIMPWVTLGLSVGTEAFNTKFGINGAYVSTNGVSVAPYVGVRLDPNVFVSAFVGGTHLNYSTMPQPGQAGQFEAWRFMVGGSLTGVWRMGPWRLQPSVDIAYGSEAQNGFTDSVGTVVPSQVVQYGRLRGGPEIGYRFDFNDRGWSLEPFVLARGNLDFATNNASFVNGQMVSLRGQGSGGVGAGFVVQGRGFNVRGDVAYDSIGLTGFDLWTGRLRAGWSF
jgi:autotransporter-like protein